ncbi:hypothetical protein C9J48_04180 [Photobacterium profundum]|uniref:Uncharacterized protein n=1 Tax=Photobacterium profundum 3TCK TaxID=314280 RepID=Q1Z7I1_9GAMM|nr:hypothetical protein [Photobacterium profundum]EAS44478.1 hypothetical protein P3TCK_15015 [Photobacterium profundum 3TCK]PSV64658.1 hypothetical protein C9J48_04180 [Photobacterium profundum]
MENKPYIYKDPSYSFKVDANRSLKYSVCRKVTSFYQALSSTAPCVVHLVESVNDRLVLKCYDIEPNVTYKISPEAKHLYFRAVYPEDDKGHRVRFELMENLNMTGVSTCQNETTEEK